MKTTVVLCHCGRPLHYSDPFNEQLMMRVVERHGEMVRVQTQNGTWLVQRHYIALHGLKEVDVAQLGFERVDVCH